MFDLIVPFTKRVWSRRSVRLFWVDRGFLEDVRYFHLKDIHPWNGLLTRRRGLLSAR